MDIEALNAGQEFEELPETYMIFVTESDFFGKELGLSDQQARDTLNISNDDWELIVAQL